MVVSTVCYAVPTTYCLIAFCNREMKRLLPYVVFKSCLLKFPRNCVCAFWSQPGQPVHGWLFHTHAQTIIVGGCLLTYAERHFSNALNPLITAG